MQKFKINKQSIYHVISRYLYNICKFMYVAQKKKTRRLTLWKGESTKKFQLCSQIMEKSYLEFMEFKFTEFMNFWQEHKDSELCSSSASSFCATVENIFWQIIISTNLPERFTEFLWKIIQITQMKVREPNLFLGS